MKENNLIEFYNEIEELKTTIRYNGASKEFHESTADHTWRLAFMCMDLKESYNIDIDIMHAIKIAFVHDLGEIKLDNDITMVDVLSGKVSKESKDNIELEVIKELSNKYNRNDIYELWMEYESQLTMESKYVKLVDRLESMLHILDKLEKGLMIDNIRDDIVYADKYIDNFPLLIPFLNEIKNRYKVIIEKIGK